MPDAEIRDWIYANAKPVKEKLTQVCFTGFSTGKKSELTELAEKANLEAVKRVTNQVARRFMGYHARKTNASSRSYQWVTFLRS